MMEWLKSLYPEVQEVIKKAVPSGWPGLEKVMEFLWTKPLCTEAMLPLASCRAVGGTSADAVHVTAAVVSFVAALRIFDDIGDQDRANGLWKQVGIARAWNYAAALHVHCFRILNMAPLPPDLVRSLIQLFVDSSFELAAGQDRDLAGLTKTIDDYWLTAEMKSGCPYGLACTAGAMTGTRDGNLIQSCALFGHHLGLVKQIFNDMESIWEPHGLSDIEGGKVTLPVVYGINLEHARRDELLSLVKHDAIAQNAGEVKDILDGIDTKEFLIWAALQEREKALAALGDCPDTHGRMALEAYITGMFGDIDSLLLRTASNPATVQSRVKSD